MGVEALVWTDPPTLTNGNDSQGYNLGASFTVASTQQCDGVQWRVSDTVVNPPGGQIAISIWRDSDGARLAFKVIDPSLFAGATNNFTFDTPVSLPAGKYVAAVYTQGYVFRSGSPAGIATPSGSAVAVEGRLVADSSGAATAAFPAANFNAIYYVSPLIHTASGTPFTVTSTESYRVLNSFTKTSAEAYRVLNAFTRSWAEIYSVLGTSAFLRTWAESYRVFNGFTVTSSEIYRVLNAWQITKPDSYRIMRFWIKTIQERFNVGDIESLPPVAVNAIAYLAELIGTANLDGPTVTANLNEVD